MPNTPIERGEKAAQRVIFSARPTKASVLAMCLMLSEEEIAGAERAFACQGPRLWRFWHDALNERKRRM